MSNYCWERGTLTLPSAAVPVVKKALRDHANTHHKAVHDLCKQVWAGPLGKTRSGKLYTERLEAWYRGLHTTGTGYSRDTGPTAVHASAHQVLQGICRPSWDRTATDAYTGTPRQATVADVERAAPKATNRTESFAVGREAHISFDGRQVTWDVPENNHADDHAHAQPIAKAFFAALGKVAWTRGTGGAVWGNSEYNEGPHGHGRGPDSQVMSFGPLGDDQKVYGYIQNGFSKTQARKIVADSKKPQRGYATASWGGRY